MEVHIEMNFSDADKTVNLKIFLKNLLADSSQSESSEKVLSTKCFETAKYEKN